jgi:uncharacterized protein (TIGR03435 family)
LVAASKSARIDLNLSSALQAILTPQENRESGTPPGGISSSSWDSITTEELAARLVRFAEASVVDETSLTGKYSVTIESWKNPDVPGRTVFDAVKKLGLKLEPRKVTVETVVVEEVSKNAHGELGDLADALL